MFEYVLNFLHDGHFSKTKDIYNKFEQILMEMDYFGISNGIQELERIYIELVSRYGNQKSECCPSFWLKFCVGGKLFFTSFETIKNAEHSTLCEWVSSVESGNLEEIRHIECKLKGIYDDTNNIFFIDRNPKYFEYILDFLRSKMVNKSNDLMEHFAAIMNEAQFYGMCGMVKELLAVKHLYSN